MKPSSVSLLNYTTWNKTLLSYHGVDELLSAAHGAPSAVDDVADLDALLHQVRDRLHLQS